MKANEKKSVTQEVSFWWDPLQKEIFLTLAPNVITSVSRDPTRVSCHQNMFRKLAKILRDSGKPAPE